MFVDRAGEQPFDELYRELTGDQRTFADHVVDGKRLVATTILRAEVHRLARLVPDVPLAIDALTELLVAMPVYRSYLPIGAEYLREAIDCAKRCRPDLADVITALEQRLADPADELASRFQQVSGAVMAKGVEDTAYYRYSRFVALNEVGGDPARFGLGPDGFHEAAQRRLAEWPAGMTTLMTHDTKRGEDVRARLAVLAELPAEWATLARQLHRLVPDAQSGPRLSAVANSRRRRPDLTRAVPRVRGEGDARGVGRNQLGRSRLLRSSPPYTPPSTLSTTTRRSTTPSRGSSA